MSEHDDELREGADDPEEDYVKKQFGLLLYRLQKLAPRSRARLQSDPQRRREALPRLP